MKQFQDLVTLAPWTFIFQICNLLILTAGVKHFLFKPVQQILAKRKEEIEASYTEAEKDVYKRQPYGHLEPAGCIVPAVRPVLRPGSGRAGDGCRGRDGAGVLFQAGGA